MEEFGDVPLYRLAVGDARTVAQHVCGGQSIGGDGALSCAVLARFEPTLDAYGGWFYRRLHWEVDKCSICVDQFILCIHSVHVYLEHRIASHVIP